MIGIDQADPKTTASATALALEKSGAPAAEKATTKPATTDNSEPKQEKSWLQRRIQIEKDWLNWRGEQIGGWRTASIAITPKFVVNNASNLASALHTVSEVAMFKANGTELMKGSEGKILDYIKRPCINIYDSLIRGVNIKFSPKELLKPSSYTNAAKGFFDLKAASQADLIKGNGQLINSWQARSTMAGMTAWLLNMVLPDVKDTPEETERMGIMATNHPIRYVGERLKQAILPWEWLQHKRQMTGLGVMIAGVCSMLGSARNVSRPTGMPQSYWFNWQYCATGFASLAASIPLLFAVDNDKGYSMSGLIHLARCVFLPGSIVKKYKMNEKDGAHYYALGHLGFQSENLGMALVGGAEKDMHGNIVDHKAMRKKAKEIALKEKDEHPTRHLLDAAEEAPAKPATKVTRTGEVALAMPERHAIAKAEQREVSASA